MTTIKLSRNQVYIPIEVLEVSPSYDPAANSRLEAVYGAGPIVAGCPECRHEYSFFFEEQFHAKNCARRVL